VTAYLDADLREPRKILREAAKTLDFGEPVAIMLLGTLNHIAEHGDALDIVRVLMEHTAPGSHLVITAATNVINPERMNVAAAAYNEAFGNPPIYMLTPERIESFFAGMEPVEPGVVTVAEWRPAEPAGDLPDMDGFVGVARKPRS
jgi:hypothetical protein